MKRWCPNQVDIKNLSQVSPWSGQGYNQTPPSVHSYTVSSTSSLNPASNNVTDSY
jgi:hypothetical protein